MLSVGLDLKYQKIDNETKDYIYKNFLFDIEHLEDIEKYKQSMIGKVD